MTTTIEALKISIHWLEVVAKTTSNLVQRVRVQERAAKLRAELKTLEAFRETE